MDLMYLNLIGSLFALGFALILAVGVLKQSPGNDRMKEISGYVHEGAMAYLKQQYIVVGGFFAVMFAVLGAIYFTSKVAGAWLVPIGFLTGGFISGLAGFIGMKIATKANCRTAQAASESLNKGLRVAFNSGTVMGMTVVGLGVLFVSTWYFIMKAMGLDLVVISNTMITFGMGASSMALFARVGGGIFTKAADVGADLVGKVEAGIPEDDPRNPAVIADNVGDNVGDVAGMGADLFESYLGSIVAAMALGASAVMNTPLEQYMDKLVVLPVVIATVGIIISILGTFLVRAKEDANQKSLLDALRMGVWASTGAIIVASFFVVKYMIGSIQGINYVGIWMAMVAGLAAGVFIAYVTEYYTSDHYKPTKDLVKTTETGPATVIIGGLSLGMMSTILPVIIVSIAILAAFYCAGGATNPLMGLYGIGLAAVGMLATLGITLATDAYGPVADNAGGIAEMSGLGAEVRKRTDALDSLGNTTAATGKGFAIGSAALTALALIASYTSAAKIINPNVNFFNLENPIIIVGLLIGAVLPFVFSAMTMGAVGRAAQSMVEEVRRQFRENKGIMEGTTKPDYASCVKISTLGAQKEMVAPSILAIVSPIIVGIILGPGAVLATLAGSLVSGFVLAVMMANAGGAWDNSKKNIEAGNMGGKGGACHKAAVVGDTVGDPFKDTSGPSINILLKLMSMVSIVFVGTCITLNAQFSKVVTDLIGNIFK